MTKRLILTVLGLAIVFGAIFGWRLFMNAQIRKHLATQQQPPVAVAAVEAERLSWQPAITSVASLRAVHGVDVTAAVPGLITLIDFDSGQPVTLGKMLVSLDSRAEIAERERLEAAMELARVQLERQKELVEKKLAPQSALDQADAEFKQIRAQIRSQQVLIDKMEIKAPFDGILGIRQVDVGQYLSPGFPIVTLQSLDPIFTDFTLPQQLFNGIRNGMPVFFTIDTYPNRVFDGTINAISPKIDPDTRNFNVQATLGNEDLLLRPGMYGQVEIRVGEPEKRVTLPQTAISYNPYGNVVFILVPEAGETRESDTYTARRRFIVTGETRGDQVAVTKGIEPGERVVVAGAHKLKEGDRAVINNSIVPSSNPSPELANE